MYFAVVRELSAPGICHFGALHICKDLVLIGRTRTELTPVHSLLLQATVSAVKFSIGHNEQQD